MFNIKPYITTKSHEILPFIHNQKLSMMDDDIEFMPIVSIEENADSDEELPKDDLPILALRNTVLFPGVVVPITIGREKSIKAVKEAYNNDRFIGILSQKKPEIEDPEAGDLHEIGTVARIIKMLKMPDGGTTIIMHGRNRISAKKFTAFEPFIRANVTHLEEEKTPKDEEFKALLSYMRDLSNQMVDLSSSIPSEVSVILKNIENPEFLIHFIASNLDIGLKKKQDILEIDDIKSRAEAVLHLLNSEFHLLKLKDKIHSKVKTDIDKQQRDYFLHQQLKTIQEELGDESSGTEILNLIKRSKAKKMPQEVRKAFDKEAKKLKRMNPAVSEYSMQLSYLELILDLPWEEFTKDNFNLKKAKQILDKDHFGLQKIKDRILEYLAVLKLKGDMKSPILCFVGPPGVGKTSLGRSIASALNRKYIRMSLGGLHDESEIRGHRRTYIGAMPGRIIKALHKAKSGNPVIILDEIDKVGAEFRGDPAAALLEVLDPEQNSTFHDNYLELEYDLSNVMFIATANSLDSIHPALQDRMEIIHLSGYPIEEKIEIAKKHLIPKQRKLHGLKSSHIQLSPKVIEKTISEYTREAGVRNLERKIAAIMRATAKYVAMDEKYSTRLKVNDLEAILGLKTFEPNQYLNDNPSGVSVGLAWTPTGGDILFIETNISKGKGELLLTGNLGTVMKESATTALSYLRSNYKELGIDTKKFETNNFHLHVPEGAIPKDGPSAGIAMLSALSSAITKRKVKPYLAMTGEITLRGKVLPVGGIKEKILAAKRAGIKEIVLSYLNRRDIMDINPDYITNLQFHYVKEMTEVLNITLD